MRGRAHGEATGGLLGALDVGLAQRQVTPEEVPLQATNVHQSTVVVGDAFTLASERTDVVAEVAWGFLEQSSAKANAHLTVDREDAVDDRALDELLSPRRVDSFTVVVDLPLADSDSEVLPFGDVNSPVNDSSARAGAGVVGVASGLEIDLEVVLDPWLISMSADLHSNSTSLERGFVGVLEVIDLSWVPPSRVGETELCAPLKIRLESAITSLESESLAPVASFEGELSGEVLIHRFDEFVVEPSVFVLVGERRVLDRDLASKVLDLGFQLCEPLLDGLRGRARASLLT